MERQGATTLRGNPLTVLGPALKPGEKARVKQALAQKRARKKIRKEQAQ